ncbi:hypothetical protein [Streptomyces sp. NPDC047841]|uniref:hypothetical protein n=1 Tax=Streptomyces sp. NPDC047841 TaxID=3154708 RepID=UPI0034540EC6
MESGKPTPDRSTSTLAGEHQGPQGVGGVRGGVQVEGVRDRDEVTAGGAGTGSDRPASAENSRTTA